MSQLSQFDTFRQAVFNKNTKHANHSYCCLANQHQKVCASQNQLDLYTEPNFA